MLSSDFIVGWLGFLLGQAWIRFGFLEFMGQKIHEQKHPQGCQFEECLAV